MAAAGGAELVTGWNRSAETPGDWFVVTAA
jgi:hypothetical protein